MNTDELRICMERLRATYSREDWTPPMVALWAEKLKPLSVGAARQAIDTMGDESEFLTVAAFRKAQKGGAAADGGVITRNGCTWSQGTGWSPCHPDELEGPRRSERLAELPELTAPPMTEERARAHMAEARRLIEQGRRAMTGDPVVAGKVDALAAALRMPEGES
ncbi:MAG TPA: hypothetical protein VJ140_14045 [Actinomycetota bacterium]|nr:hypothetical protein [Actinomycetota bacterium]